MSSFFFANERVSPTYCINKILEIYAWEYQEKIFKRLFCLIPFLCPSWNERRQTKKMAGYSTDKN